MCDATGTVHQFQPSQVDTELRWHESLEGIAQHVASLEVPTQQVRNALRLIADSPQPVVATGVGKSSIAAEKFSATLSSLGVPALRLDPVNALHGDLGVVQQGATVVLISNSGSTGELVSLIPWLRARDCRLIAVVGDSASSLGKASDSAISFGQAREIDKHGLAPTTSFIVQVAILDTLAVLASEFRGHGPQHFAVNHPSGMLGKRLQPIASLMRKGADLPAVITGSRLVDALTNITNGRLGCVCVVDQDMKLRGLVTDGDLRRAVVAGSDIRKLSVDEVMNPSPHIAFPSATIGDAIDDLNLVQYSALPVVDATGLLVGILASVDVL